MWLRLLVAGVCLCGAGLQARSPNILLILADDLAWSDLGCYGGQACETPHLDRLATEGMRFTDAYAAAPLCSPARAALLTGKSPARLRFEFVTKWADDKAPRWPEHKVAPPPYTLNLPLEEETIAELLAGAGYQTGIVGKWHLNTHHETYNGWSPVFGPRRQGFAYAVETFGSHPWAWRGKQAPSFENLAPGAYAPDELTDAAIEFIEDGEAGSPFFLFVSHFYVHTPVAERGGWLKRKYRRKLGPGVSEKRVLYGGFVETLDHHFGRLLQALDEQGLAEETVVVFTSDNGGHPEYAANAPLRGSKWHLHEGGIRVPMIVRWPGHVEAGGTSDAVVLGTDLFATMAELAGVPSRTPDGLDSNSFTASLRGEPLERTRPAVWHFPYYHPEKGFPDTAARIGIGDEFVARTRPLSAIREGRYKLLYFHEDERVELYDLASDIGERHNLAPQRPRLTRELRAKLLAYLERVDARFPERR
ncbi:MAG: sulfatase [bacterium]|nr:sulfatase [bacterium]